MEPITWILVVVLALLALVAAAYALRRKQRSGDVLAAAGPGTSTNPGGEQ